MSIGRFSRPDPLDQQPVGAQYERSSSADASPMSVAILRAHKIPTDTPETVEPDSQTLGSSENPGSPQPAVGPSESAASKSVSPATYTGLKIPTERSQTQPLVAEIGGLSAEQPAQTCRGVKKLLRNRENPREHRMLWLPARTWKCPGCRQTLEENYFRDLLPRVTESNHLEEHHFPGGKESTEYKTTQRQIERRRACYLSIAQPGGAVAILTTAHVGGEPASANRLGELIRAIPEDLPRRCHPVTISANWRTPKQKARRKWEVVGSAKTDESEVGTYYEAKKVLDRYGIAFESTTMRVEGVERPCLEFYLTDEMLKDAQRYERFIISLKLDPRVPKKEPRAA